MSKPAATIEYASPTVRPPARTGRISLSLGFVAAVLELLLCSGVFASNQVLPAMAFWLTVLLIPASLGFGIAGVVNRAAGARLGLALAACNIVALLGMVAHVLLHPTPS